ncbi:Fic family protein [Rubneribacter sp.]|nr:Fic family protein [Candidatus Rubneribacter avistercoris]
MTADNPSDFPYEPVRETADSVLRQGYWDVATGLQQVDGLVPSDYLRSLAHEHASGVRSIEETGRILRAYYRERPRQSLGSQGSCPPDEQDCREADLVSQRIVEVLSRGAFALMPSMLSVVHKELFCDLDPQVYGPGRYKTVALQKSELVLNGDSVVYADPSLVERSLAFLFDEELGYAYGVDLDEASLAHLARFVARLWQVHPFAEGNTRTVAVFTVLYLRHLGFDADNEPFARHARYFRDALVRANYRNAKAKVMPDASYLLRFFENLLSDARHELRSRDLMVHELYADPSLLRNVDPSRAIAKP